ncbi:LysR family transcriptional regulator [Geodermatophilus nigrescens]|uniref:DNA-binding transcriptional regulator, LysR family n=1 Tax=Geodermatophilus nigrescens TaxID=1070870 RepID=A0A1M5Q695_9ACTN|nr:LysR substrate-binding domain-containing protein [Geodermatophilus nigrescens]SHH09426.1 DNA-binding transcriptional regulator, LysR family [Geodermatophilus nigrescens]
MTGEVTVLGLRVIRQVAASGSFAAAAVELGYTQSAVSRQIAALESAVGERLFTRGRRGVQLTAAGEVVLRGAGRALAELDATGQQLARLHDRLAGRLTVSAFPTAAAVLVPRAVADLAAAHPTLQVVLDEAASPVALRRLRAGRTDVAVVAAGPGLPDPDLAGLEVSPLVPLGLLVAVPEGHRLARTPVVRPGDLADVPWIVGTGAPGEPQFGPWPTLAEPRVAFSVRHWTTRLGLVAAGLGVTVLPGTMAAAVPAGVRVVAIDDPSWPGRRTLVVTRRPPDRAAALAARAVVEQAEALRSGARGG